MVRFVGSDSQGEKQQNSKKLYMIVTLTHPYQNKEELLIKGSILLSAALPKSLTRTNILQELIRQTLISENFITASLITTNPRNYYLDLLLSKEEDLFYSQDQVSLDEPFKLKRLVKLPFSLQIVSHDQDWMIDNQCQTITPKYFDILDKIGQGSYSQIYLVERKYDRHLFCMKRINKAECREKGSLQMIKNELQILQYSSKYKIKLYYQFQDAKNVYFILDFCPFGDLFSLIKSNKKMEEYSKMTLTQKYSIWIQIAFGIASIHDKGLIYRDLKPQNILIDEYQRVRICDFGFSCKIKESQKLNSLCGSYEYIAPEMLKKEGYDKSIDLYCLGLLFYQLLVGTNPFEGITPKNVVEIKNKAINFEKKQISTTVKDLLKKLLKERPQQRLGYESTLDVFHHQFFKQNEDLVRKIIKGQSSLKNIRYVPPQKMAERDQLDEKQAFIFKGVPYHYLRPYFNVTENVGPKFQG